MAFEILGLKLSAWAFLPSNVNHHKGNTHWRYYEDPSKIKGRINWDYGVNDKSGNIFHKKSEDEDGVFTLEWKEGPTLAARILVITAAVAIAVVEAAAIMTMTLGFGTAVAAALVAAAEVAAVALLDARERHLKAIFLTENLEMVKTQEAQKVKDLNKTQIKQALDEITKLLDDKDAKKFDQDAAKAKLEEISKKQFILEDGKKLQYRDIFSKANKAEFQKLEKLQQEKVEEYTKIHIANHAKVLQTIQETSQEMEKELQKFQDESLQRIKAVIQGLDKLSQELLSSIDTNIHEFEKSLKDMDEKHRDIISSEENIQAKIEELHHEYMGKFTQAQEEEQCCYNQSIQDIQNFHDSVVANNKKAEDIFQELQKRKDLNYKLQCQTIQGIKGKYGVLASLMDQNFTASKRDEEIYYNNKIKGMKVVKDNIITLQEQFNQAFTVASSDREVKREKQREYITKLQAEQASAFAQASAAREEDCNKTESKILNVRQAAEEQFNRATEEALHLHKVQQERLQTTRQEILNARQAAEEQFNRAAQEALHLHQVQQEKLQTTRQEMLNARQAAEEQFNRAAQEALHLHQAQQERLQTTRQEILNARKAADEAFAKAAQQRAEFKQQYSGDVIKLDQKLIEQASRLDRGFEEAKVHMNQIYEETKAQLVELNENVDTARKEIDTNFKKAEAHMNQIHEETKAQLVALNENVDTARKEIDANFKKAEAHMNQIHEETKAQLVALNENVDTARKEIDANFKKAEAHMNQIHEETETKLSDIQQNVLRDELCIQVLLTQKNSLDMEIKAISDGSHEQIISVKNKAADKGIKLYNFELQNKDIQEINSLIEQVNSASPAEGYSIIQQAIDKSMVCAGKFGSSYNFDMDQFKLKTLLKMQAEFFYRKGSFEVLEKFTKNELDLGSLQELFAGQYQGSIKSNKENPAELEQIVRKLLEGNEQLKQLSCDLQKDHNSLVEEWTSLIQQTDTDQFSSDLTGVLATKFTNYIYDSLEG